MTHDDYAARHARYRALLESALEAAVPQADDLPGDGDIPGLLGRAMRYSLLGGGKRLRGVLLLAACETLDGDVAAAAPFAAALEMIHAYSLVHDDLPAMDDDDLRRGKPTNHKVFGEGMAVLAGDGLLNLAYETMAGSGHPRALWALGEIAARAGVRGMIAGQTLDVSMEGAAPTPALVRYIHAHKTADLFIAAVAAGFLLAGAQGAALDAARAYGMHLGTAFQIVDDLLDLTGDEALLGKRAGKDAQHGKLTWPACAGVEEARKDAAAHIAQAAQALDALPCDASFLKTLALSTLERVQ